MPLLLGRILLTVLEASLASFFSCRLTCFSRWSDLTKGRLQVAHTNFFSPVCARLCRDSSSLRAKILSQSS